jgi:hypothetical protein
VIARPENNSLTVTVYNNSVFYNTNNNLLTDTTAVGFASDMTPWNMIIEFIPVAESKHQKFYEL